MADPKIKRVLISVTDKTGIAEFASALCSEFGAEIISTGGTASMLTEAGVAVTPIEEVTGFPEMMDGRVKTLHPKVHGGLLARREDRSHQAQAVEHGIDMIDMVVVNLYAFTKTVASGADFATCIENIDIGGPSMLRSAAKNHASVAVVTDPASYDGILAEMRANNGTTTAATRRRLALEVFRLTGAYDNAIYAWLCDWQEVEADSSAVDGKLPLAADPFPAERCILLDKLADLRYGENPHQQAAFYRSASRGSSGVSRSSSGVSPASSGPGVSNPDWELASAPQLQGKELSYNNYLDLDAAWTAVREFTGGQPCCVIVKHLTPCGIACALSVTEAYRKAHDCDPVSAYGGVMAFNVEVPATLIEAIYENGQFIEALIAPSYEAGALELLAKKPNARVLATGGLNKPGGSFDFRSVEGGMLVMTADTIAEDPANFTVPTKREPTPEEREELLFAWRACKSVKSNAIVITKGAVTLGIGAGQPNRVNSAELAAKQAGEAARGAVAASDAFMPFADSLEVLIGAGVTAVIQPGGSVRDAEVIAAADAAGVALLFTGHRHFRH